MTQKTLRMALRVIGGALLLALPWMPGVQLSYVVNAILAGEYALVAISLVVLTGWVGQISLGQGTFVGIGAFSTGLLVRELGVPFPLNLPLVAVITAGVAAILGVVALRVRGLYLAVATLIFAWMADAYLFRSPWFVGEGGSSSIKAQTIGRPGTLTFFDLSDKRVFYVVMVAAVAAALYAVSNLRESKTGRAFFAIRGSEMAAGSLGIDLTRYKLMAFAISGGLAGIAGNLTMTGQRTASPVSYQFTVSLLYLSIAVVGGIASLPGAIGASVLFAGIYQLFFEVDFLEGWFEIVTIGMLLLVLLIYPGGVGALLQKLRAQVTRATRLVPIKRSPSESGSPSAPMPEQQHLDWRTMDVKHYELSSPREDRPPILSASGITVQFGGLRAVDNVSLEVREHEIVGLIGPNGAGKTTLFNAISGLNEPTSGTVTLFGEDATGLPVHLRARKGVGRTFQLIQLFPQLSVFDNLLVATHLHNPTGIFSHITLTDRAVAAERDAREQVHHVIRLLNLEDFAHRTVGGLPFGILRQVEIARALVTKAPLLMLDEPASGLDNTETDELSQLLFFLRAELGISILLIEHDVKMVTSVCDYIYVINRGAPLAQGTSQEVQRNPEVIAAYLGEAVEEVVA